MNTTITATDKTLITFFKHHHDTIARVTLFIVFFWFGVLKITGDSPANPLVQQLFEKIIPFASFNTFIICFGLYEMIIGLLFLIPKTERLALALLLPHIFTTVLPLIALPAVTWQRFLVPTMEGQYIIKNLVILALAVSVAANLHPLKLDKKPKK